MNRIRVIWDIKMDLIFAYIKKFGGFIHDQSIHFSNDFEVHLENKILSVREKKNYLKHFYGDGIKNISVFVGKNGSGKTTLLDILGMNRNDRLRGSVKKNEIDDEYFQHFDIHTVGASYQQEIWVLAQAMEKMHQHMIGKIQVICEIYVNNGVSIF